LNFFNNFGSGFPPLDAYGECRRNAAFAALDTYYKQTKAELIKNRRITDVSQSESADIDAAARDAIRCLEHAIVIIAGEKSIYKCVISPSSSHTHDEKQANNVSMEMKLALLASYSHVTSIVVDKTMDIIETVFFKDAAIAKFDTRSTFVVNDENQLPPFQTVRATASAAAAGLRILDGVRLLGPSLTKLCELSDASHVKEDDSITLAAGLCIGIHRTTVKNTAKALENLIHAIKNDPVNGEKHRPADARVAALSSDVVRAIRVISPFVAAYKSVTKRRSLSWDTNIGDNTKDIGTYAKHIMSKLLKNLSAKSMQYTKEINKTGKEKDATLSAMQEAKQGMFMVNNTYYLLEQLCIDSNHDNIDDQNDQSEHYYIEKSNWLRDMLNKSFLSEKKKYLEQWESINTHLTSVPQHEIKHQNNSSLLTLESGRLFKSRFSGFIEVFELNFSTHKSLTVADLKLRDMLREDIKKVFLSNYTQFYDRYSKLHFSKKNSDMYLKYPPSRVNDMVEHLFFVQ